MNNAKLDMGNQLYTDLNSLQQIKRVGHKDRDAGLREVSRQFETMFVQMMLKSMRDANATFEEGDFTNSSEMQMHRDMYDQQLSLSLTQGKGIGLAEQMYRQMSQLHGEKQKATGEFAPVQEKALTAPAEGAGKALNWTRGPAGQLVREAKVEGLDTTRTAGLDLDKQASPVPPAWLKQFAEAEEAAAKLEAGGDVASVKGADSGFKDRVEFLRELYPHAQKAAQQLGVEPKWLLAQAALETGWGQHMVSDSRGSSNNLFNIKATDDWTGRRANVDTLEYRGGVAVRERAQFRAYDSYADSFNDYVKLLQKDRYQDAVEQGDTAYRFAHGLQRAGYATDPAYASKIMRVLGSAEMSQAWSAAVLSPTEG